MKGSPEAATLFSTKNLPGENTAQIINLDAITFNSVDNLPELIIIDEVTHFSGLEMQILNEFAKRNGISILALGDTNQNGFNGLSRNMDREKIIAVRSPKLSISLRDVNLQKQENLLNILHILNSMSKLDSDLDPLYDQKFKELTKLIGQINFRVYNQDELNGDLITGALTSEQVGKLFGRVAFVGKTDDDAYKKLQEHGDNIEEVVVLQPDEIQGQEFDFIVVDQDWSMDASRDVRVFNFLTYLYTMMSRGKVGSIFIDKGLSNIIGQNKESLSKESAPNLRDAVEPFIEAKLDVINQLDLVPNEEFEQEIAPTEETADDSSTDEEAADEEVTDEVLPEDESLQVDDDIETDEEAEQDRKDMVEALGDKTDELVQKSMENIELDPSFPIRIYGSAHFAGLLRTTKKIDGKDVTIYTNPHSEVKSDLQIFMKGEEADGPEMDRLVSSLLNLKSVLLYGNDPRSLHSSVSSVVDAEHLKGIKYKIEVRPLQETDNFVGFTGLETEGTQGNRPDINGLVYTLVGEFKNNAGETCKVTLGLLANPDSFFVSEQAKKKGKETEVTSKIDRYRKVFENITKQYQRDGKFYQDVTPQFSGLTHIRRTTGVGESRRPVQIRTLEEFKRTHPYTVVSDPYIFTGKNFKGLNTSKIRGHAVVFVSNDTTLKPDELMQLYIEQKEATIREPNADLFNLSTKPKVRMLMLDSAGVSFKSLTFTKKMKDLYSTEQIINGKKSIKMFPFEEDYMGARMFTSLWNYRANLRKFLDAYEDFKSRTGLSDEDVLRIARYADASHKKGATAESEFDDNVQEILSTTSATADEMKLLSDFNDSLASSVRQFRIGGSRKQSGVYLRQLTNISGDNTFYQGIEGTPIGIYITPQVAQKQWELINTLLGDTLGSIIELKDGEGVIWPDTRTISSKTGYSNSLSGLITTAFAGGAINVTEDGVDYTLQLPNSKTFIYVPILLQKIYQGLRRLQNDPDTNYENITIGEKSGNPRQVNYLKLAKLLSPSTEDFFDSSFDDMLALAFHGTTSDPATFISVPSDQKKHPRTRPNSSMRATDAYFKDGFFIDPMGAEVVGESSTGAGLFKRCLTNGNLLTVNAETDMPIFTVTLTDLEKAYDDSTAEPVTQQEIIPQDVRDFFSNPENVPPAIMNDIQDLFSTVKSMEEFLQKAEPIMNNYLQKEVIPQLFKNRQKVSTIMSEDWSADFGTMTSKTVQQHLEELSGKSFEGAKMSWDGENLLVTLPDGITHIKVGFDEYSSDFTITTVIESPQTETGNVEEKATNKLQIAQGYIASYLSDPDNAEKLEDFKNEYETLYDELKTQMGSYASIEDLMKALKGMEEPTEWDDVILEIEELVSSANEGLKCKY